MDGPVLAVLAAYQNNLVKSKNDDVTSDSKCQQKSTFAAKVLLR